MASTTADKHNVSGFFNSAAGKFTKGLLKFAFFGVAMAIGMDFFVGGLTHANAEIAKETFGAFQELANPIWEGISNTLPGATVDEKISPLTNLFKSIHEFFGIYDTYLPDIAEAPISDSAQLAAEKLTEETAVEGVDFLWEP